MTALIARPPGYPPCLSTCCAPTHRDRPIRKLWRKGSRTGAPRRTRRPPGTPTRRSSSLRSATTPPRRRCAPPFSALLAASRCFACSSREAGANSQLAVRSGARCASVAFLLVVSRSFREVRPRAVGVALVSKPTTIARNPMPASTWQAWLRETRTHVNDARG